MAEEMEISDSEKETLNQIKRQEAKKTFRKSFIHVVKNVTVEPTLGIYMLSYVFLNLTTQNLSLEKACRVNLNFSAEICDSLMMQELESRNMYELQTQKLVTQYLSYRTYISATIPCVLVFLVGSFSDKTGRRKLFLIMPMTGQILACISGMLNVYFLHQLSLEVLLFSEALIEGLSGGLCLVVVTSFAFISTITTDQERTFRIGLLDFGYRLGYPVGMAIGGVLLKGWGYYAAYGITASLHLINLLYNTCLLTYRKRTILQKQHNRGLLHLCRIFFDIDNIKQTMRVVFKNGANNRRVHMCLSLLVISILCGIMHGNVSILYMNTRIRFLWDEVQFSIFQSYNSFTGTIGSLFAITVFSKFLKWHDSTVGIIALTSKLASSFVYSFAPNEQIFYLAALVDIMSTTSFLTMRSIVSKLVASGELGKVNSVFGLVENLVPLGYVPLYTTVYTATMEQFPGAVFLMGGAMIAPAMIIFIWICYEHRKEVRKLHQQKVTELLQLR